MTSYIPLNEPTISDHNVRTVSASKETDKELIASIASQGVLQNLVVIPGPTGTKEVVAMDVLYYSRCQQILSGSHWRVGGCLDASFTAAESITSRNDTDDSLAFEELEAARSKLNTEWLTIENGDERFNTFRALSKKMKEQFVTYCIAQSLRIGVRGTDPAQHALAEMLSVDFSKYRRPTKDNYFSRLSKLLLLAQFAPLRHKDWADMYHDMKKYALVESMEEWFASKADDENTQNLTWVPPEF